LKRRNVEPLAFKAFPIGQITYTIELIRITIHQRRASYLSHNLEHRLSSNSTLTDCCTSKTLQGQAP